MKTINIKGETFVLTENEYYELLLDPQTFLKENFEVNIPDYISIQSVEEEEEDEDEDTLCGIPYLLLFSDMFK